MALLNDLRIYKLTNAMLKEYLKDQEKTKALTKKTRLKLDEVTKLLDEFLEMVEVLGDPDMMKKIRQGQEDIKAGRVKELRRLLKEEAR